MLDAASQWTVAVMVLAVFVFACFKDSPMLRAALAILVNWILCTGLVYLSHNYTPWIGWLIIDTVTAWVVMWHPAGKAQSLIGALYIVQIGFHCAFGIDGFTGTSGVDFQSAASGFYLDILSWIGRGQLAVLIAGGGYGLHRRFRGGARFRGHSGNAVAARGAHMEGGGE